MIDLNLSDVRDHITMSILKGKSELINALWRSASFSCAKDSSPNECRLLFDWPAW